MLKELEGVKENPANLLHCPLDIFLSKLGLHGLLQRDGRGGNGEYAPESGCIQYPGILYRSCQQDDGNMLPPCFLQDARRYFPHKSLPVRFPFSGDEEVGILNLFCKVQSFQKKLYAGFQLCIQKCVETAPIPPAAPAPGCKDTSLPVVRNMTSERCCIATSSSFTISASAPFWERIRGCSIGPKKDCVHHTRRETCLFSVDGQKRCLWS